MSKKSATFLTVADFKALHGINRLNLCYNPELSKFSLRLDDSRVYIRIDSALVLNPELGARATIDTTQDMSILCDDESQGMNLDSVCLVAVSPSTVELTGSAI